MQQPSERIPDRAFWSSSYARLSADPVPLSPKALQLALADASVERVRYVDGCFMNLGAVHATNGVSPASVLVRLAALLAKTIRTSGRTVPGTQYVLVQQVRREDGPQAGRLRQPVNGPIPDRLLVARSALARQRVSTACPA